ASQYERDVARFVTAFETDSKAQREKLVAALANSKAIAAIDAGDRTRCFARAPDVYVATERLKELFAGVDGVLLVDDSYSCLRGEAVRELLEACGASRYLEPIGVNSTFSYEERREMRRTAGCEGSSRGETIED